MAQIEIRLSSKEDKQSHRCEILIRFFNGTQFDAYGKSGIFILPSHFRYYVNRAACEKAGVHVPAKTISVTMKEAEAKGYSIRKSGEIVISEKIDTEDVKHDKEADAKLTTGITGHQIYKQRREGLQMASPPIINKANIMCVIIIRQAGKPLPSDAELKRAYTMNPHGCGFVSKSMKFKSLSFSNFLKRLHEVPQDENCIIHFRYATNGSVCRQNCHPFTKKGISFAHNGILSIMPDGDRTDSETAFRNIIYPCVQQYGFDSDELRLAVEEIIGYSKFALMNENGEIRLFGDFKAHDGRLYSNLRHFGIK